MMKFMMVCGNCRVLVQVEHTQAFDSTNMPECRCCDAVEWPPEGWSVRRLDPPPISLSH